MHYTDIAEKIASEKLRPIGANPNASVAVALSNSLRAPNSPFQKVGTGLYALRENVNQASEGSEREASKVIDELHSGTLRAFGMYWRRERINWTPSQPKLLGLQKVGSSKVDFAKQIGVYLLHDRDRVAYVGRANDRLFLRLKAHTSDRLEGRWDRFSWFGLLDVGEDGTLIDKVDVPWNHNVVVETLEALLIESLKPPLNRRRGDKLESAEYLQADDPALKKAREQSILKEVMDKHGRME